MRKSMIAVSCLLLSGVAMAKDVSHTDGALASRSILATALQGTQQREAAPVGQPQAADGWMAAKSKKTAAKAAPQGVPTRLADPSNRFNMTQDGKKMTADDFDKWMKKNGYRVATGAPAKAEDGVTKGGAK